MAQQERAIRTRRNVLEAAGRLFAERGYEATSIADILELSGVTRGALYFHFPSKAALAEGVMTHAVLEPPVEQALVLQSYVDMGLELAYRLPREPLLRGSARLAADQGSHDYFGLPWPAWVSRGEEMMAEAKERGEVLPHVDAAITARLVVGAFTGVQLLSEAENKMADFADMVSRLYELTLPAVATPSVLAKIDTSPQRGAMLAGLR